MEQYEMYFTSIKNELMETEGWVKIDVSNLKLPLDDYLRTGRIRKVEQLMDIDVELEIKKDLIRLNFLDWLKEKDYITDDSLVMWEEYITERATNDE